jgi:hypothetical protein
VAGNGNEDLRSKLLDKAIACHRNRELKAAAGHYRKLIKLSSRD